eukprot:772227-Heterocapsa_arctica.AAC.1
MISSTSPARSFADLSANWSSSLSSQDTSLRRRFTGLPSSAAVDGDILRGRCSYVLQRNKL